MLQRLLVVTLLSLLSGACAPAAAAPPCPSAPAAVSRTPTVASPRSPGGEGRAPSFDPTPWLEDLDALTSAMASHYANLDYALVDQHLDLPAIKAKAVARIRGAEDEDGARLALTRFLNAFHDGHLSVHWARAPRPQPTAAPPDASLCARLGYEAEPHPGVNFALGGTYKPETDGDATDIPGGILELPQGKLGIVRIDLFEGRVHPALCETARTSLGLSNGTTCDDACKERLDLAVEDRLTAALERRIISLTKAGATAIALDLSGNGGGDDWVDAVARTLTTVHLKIRPMGAVRHPHWEKELERQIADLTNMLTKKGDLPRGEIKAGLEHLRAALAEVRTPCDKHLAFEPGAPLPDCKQLVPIPPLLDYAPPGALASNDKRDLIFGPARYAYHEGVSRLPLAVIVDGGTASAAEHLVEMIQDQRAGTVLGSPTVGAGCGYTNGGIPTELPHSHAEVQMPDCARFRADGSNAVAGVLPDVLLPLLDRDSPSQRASKVVHGLSVSWNRILHPLRSDAKPNPNKT